jgi:hypothetical protein
MDDKTAGVEHLLVDYTRRLARFPGSRRAVIIHLSRLRPDNRRVHHIRIAANTFETLVKQFNGQIFVLQNADIIFICKDASVAIIDEAIGKLRYFFGDDPLAADLDEAGPDNFTSWFDLERDYPAFLAIVEKVHEEAERRKKRLAALTGDARDEREPLDPAGLAELVKTIAGADLSNVLRRQAICMMNPGEPPKAIFREIYISIPDLRDAIMPRRDITSDRWLFQYLTQMLDKRVLSILRKNDDQAIAHSYSLNLNVSTLLSPEFIAFDQSLRQGARGSIVIELEKVDIFADVGAYFFAREFLRERGYRLCLDGLSGIAFPLVEREKFGFDLVKLFWSPDLVDKQHSERGAELRAALEQPGKSRIILARCDNEDAVEFGLAAGLRLFQGRHVDRLLAIAGGATAPISQRKPGTVKTTAR